MGIFSAWYLTSCIRNKKVIRTIKISMLDIEHEYGGLEVYVILISSIVIAPLFLFFCAYDSYLYFNPAPASAPASNRVVLKPITRIKETNKSNEVNIVTRKTLHGPADNCTLDCKINGECSLINGECIATKTLDCLQSERCKEHALCSLSNGQCTMLTNRDCIMSDQCKVYGKCMAWISGCVATKSIECARSLNCKKYGFCSVDGEGGCEAIFKIDCVRSEVCRKYGFCSAVKGKCAKK